MAFLGFHTLSPISTPFHTFLLISTVDSHTLVWALEFGFCLTTVECPMRGRISADEDVWLYHKWKQEFDVDSPL